MMETRAIMCSN